MALVLLQKNSLFDTSSLYKYKVTVPGDLIDFTEGSESYWIVVSENNQASKFLAYCNLFFRAALQRHLLLYFGTISYARKSHWGCSVRHCVKHHLLLYLILLWSQWAAEHCFAAPSVVLYWYYYGVRGRKLFAAPSVVQYWYYHGPGCRTLLAAPPVV